MARRKFQLSQQRAKWAKGRTTKLRGLPMRTNEATANRFAKSAESMVTKMARDVKREILALFDSELGKTAVGDAAVAMDASISSQARILINQLTKKWERVFAQYAISSTEWMQGQITHQTASDLTAAMEKLSGGLNISAVQLSDRSKDILKAGAAQSTSLIKTIAPDYMAEVGELVMRSIAGSNTSFTALKEGIDKGLTGKWRTHKNKAKNIALDQTRKNYQNLAASRMADAGIQKFVWRHSGGSQQPRSYHRDVLAGQTFDVSNPPVIDQKTGERGLPGHAINCKCYMEPVIDLGE